jgi:transposase
MMKGNSLRNDRWEKLGHGAEGKTPVAGIVERQGRVIAKKVINVKSKTLMPMLTETVAPKSTVYTDDMRSYGRVRRYGYKHHVINHSAKVYVEGNVHTNTIDGFWSLLKRGIGGVYHAISEKHLQNYLNEYVFRYNHRKDEQPMFTSFLTQISKV